ncbi:pyrroline-5-carboxylate reductase, partial [filamentous cyanobacterium Phorm 46]
MTKIKFGTIGGGVMGEALLSRLIAQKVYLPSEILVSDPQPQRREFLTETYGIGTTASNLEVATAT